MTDIRNTDEVIDSRDVIARIEELEAERDSFVIGAPDGTETPAPDQWAEENPDEFDELEGLQAFATQAQDYAPDWEYGATLIHEDYFTQYCEEMVKDIGDLPQDIPAYLEIDWDATAANLKVDYTEVEFDGQTYLVR